MPIREELQEWRYLYYGRVRHLVYGGRMNTHAYCLAQPKYGDAWLGTGSQDEYERCASLPKCKVCLKSAGL